MVPRPGFTDDPESVLADPGENDVPFCEANGSFSERSLLRNMKFKLDRVKSIGRSSTHSDLLSVVSGMDGASKSSNYYANEMVSLELIFIVCWFYCCVLRLMGYIRCKAQLQVFVLMLMFK